MADTIETYKRLVKAAKCGRGIRLSLAEIQAILRDGAIWQALETAEEEERPEV